MVSKWGNRKGIRWLQSEGWPHKQLDCRPSVLCSVCGFPFRKDAGVGERGRKVGKEG